MFDKLDDLKLINEYKKETTPPNIYWIALGSIVIELVWRYFRFAFYWMIAVLLLFILGTFLKKLPLEKEKLLKSEILRRIKKDNKSK